MAQDYTKLLDELNEYHDKPESQLENKINISVSCILKAIGLVISNSKEVTEEYKKIQKDFQALTVDDIRQLEFDNAASANLEKYKESRDKTKRIQKNTENPDNAAQFLARLKGSTKLDKIIARNYFDLPEQERSKLRQGQDPSIYIPVKSEYTGKNWELTHELLKLYESGKIVHLAKRPKNPPRNERPECRFSYKEINEKWLFRVPTKNLLKKILRDQIGENDPETEEESWEHLKVLVDLIFGIEIKRNPAGLLTNAMFVDLLGARKYEIEDFRDKLPMAFAGAVDGSTTVDKIAEFPIFDFRSVNVNQDGIKNAKELVRRDEKILKDWLKLEKENRGNSNDIEFNGDVEATVNGQVFFDFIKDWYGIEVSKLKSITLKIRFNNFQY